jgi:hypothetical protein
MQEGSLVQRDFADLVQDLAERRWTGVLTLTNGGVGRSVTVQDGRLVFASSSSPDDRLGELLLRRGRISFRQYVDAGKAIVPGKRLGTILVEQGILPPKDLVRAVVDHTQEIIYGAFQWTEGRYRFQEGTTAETITLNISTPDIIMEGIRRIESWSRIDRAVGGIGARYDRPSGYETVAAKMTLADEKLKILTRISEERIVEELCAESSLPDIDVCRTLWAFRVIGLVRLLDPPRRTKPEIEDDGLGLVL